jgi:hypothetical protein
LIIATLRFHVDAVIRAGCPLIGAGAMALQLWLYGVIQVPWLLLLVIAPWLLVAVLWRRAFTLALRTDAAGLRQLVGGFRDLDPLTAGIVVLTVATAGFYFLNLLAQPLVGWDSIAMWMFKAKVFLDAGSVDLSRIPVNVTPPVERHLDYPPLFPLMVDSFWVLIGRVDDVIGKAIGFVFLISAVITAAAIVLPLLGKRLTAMIAFILVAMPTLQTSFIFPYYMGYADYGVGALMMISLAHLYRATRLGKDEASALALLFAALAALTKNEGLTFLLVVAIVTSAGLDWVILRRREQPPVRLIGVAVAGMIPVLAWQVYARVHGFNNDLINAAGPHWTLGLLASKLHTVGAFVWSQTNRYDDYPWLAAAWLVSTAMALVSRHPRLVAVWAIVSAQAGFYLLGLILRPYDLTFLLVTSADRLILQLSPALVLLLGLALRAYPRAEVVEQAA